LLDIRISVLELDNRHYIKFELERNTWVKENTYKYNISWLSILATILH